MADYKKLIKRCLKNDRRAQNELYRELFSFLMNICIRYKYNYDDAGSALNIIYMKVLKGLNRYDIERDFLPWVKTIAIRHLVDEFRVEKRNNMVGLEEQVNGHVVDHISGALTKLNMDDILRMIRDLPEPTGQVFNLYVIDGYKHKEIAKMLNIVEGTSKWYLSQARKMLREQLETENERLENIKLNL